MYSNALPGNFCICNELAGIEKGVDSSMKKLMEQIMKFGAVGVICFFIDYIVSFITFHIVMAIGVFGENSFSIGSMIGSALGFTVSVIVNYILSFKFVFERKEDMNRKAEFVIFIILSVIGLGLNQVVMWICTVPIYNNVEWVQQLLGYSLAFTVAKIVATAIVMVYNFVTRKIFLEKK